MIKWITITSALVLFALLYLMLSGIIGGSVSHFLLYVSAVVTGIGFGTILGRS